MRPIQMVDTRSQYLKIKKEVDEAVLEVMGSSAFINGPAVQAFAKNLENYLQTRHVIPCANGTDALQIALMALGLQPGDEVMTPSFTFIATTEVVALLQLKPVFVEVDKQTFCIDIDDLEKKITPQTKAIIPVHLYGQAANMEAIMKLADKHGIAVIEDNAQAIGADFIFGDGTKRKTGTIGHIGCTSFYPSKNLGAFGDGGAICTDDDALAAKMRMIANHGQSKRYYHDTVGCNSRLDSIQAAILNIKLQHLDAYNQARQAVAHFYNQSFLGQDKLTVPFTAPFATHVYHQYTLILNDVDRDALIAYLGEKGVPAMIYYPVAGHQQKMFEQFKIGQQNLPVTDWLTSRVVSLPIHTEMDEAQLQWITQSVLEFINQ
ncbi:DegT/DnrJ/EryC1/StrS family aminotransferase [Niabella insulamsoli]|uniref:DegT/DnrJ/EryC1/StrS family aminotransferase n=1 Tax=Niabella insulamsoli TaxID=3144874 RepID=UPI0031FD26CA